MDIKDVVGYEGIYKVTFCGDIFKGDKLMKQQKTKLGYSRVCFRTNGRSKCWLVHRIVAEAFIQNPNNKPQVNHINGIRDDNRVGNLEWVDNRENALHGMYELGHQVFSVSATNIKTGEVLHFRSLMEAERNGFRHCSISGCLKGRLKTHAGYTWEKTNGNTRALKREVV